MPKKRTFAAWVSLIVALSFVLSACSSGDSGSGGAASETPAEASSGDPAPAPADAAPKLLEYDVVAEYQNLPDENPTMKDKLVMEKFNIKTDTNYITLAEGLEKLSVLFASGNYPDYIPNLNHEAEVKRWGEAGFLVPLSDHMDALSEYRKWWTDEEWNVVTQFAQNPDGKLYYLPAKNYRSHSKAWIYRKDVFDALGLKFPETLDELYAALKAIKAAYPDSVPISNRGKDGVIGIAVNAYRLPGDMWYGFEGFYRDPDANDEVMYAQATDKFRESLKFINKLYKEDLIEKEFPTMTTEQWTQRGVSGRSFIMYDYATRAAYFQNLMQDTPEAQWDWAPVTISTGDKPGFVDRELPFFSYGPIVTNKVEGERLDRLLEYFNWAASPEGVKFHTLGVEGETYEVVDGKPQYSNGAADKHEMFQKTGFIEFLVTDPEYVASNEDRQTDLAVSEAFKDKPFVPFTAFNLSAEDRETANSLITGVTDIAEQFYVKAIMGQVDVNDDAVWNQYVQELNQAGLTQLLELHRKSAQ
ncbi:extracellular solute-binding protein [Paenibacillus antri]|nr:extracellular solute-binding protein [Paenibacillus antri]